MSKTWEDVVTSKLKELTERVEYLESELNLKPPRNRIDVRELNRRGAGGNKPIREVMRDSRKNAVSTTVAGISASNTDNRNSRLRGF